MFKEIPSALRAQASAVVFQDSTESVSLLGIAWNPDRDTFQIKLNIEPFPSVVNITKRIVLSYISQTFDPLGIISPVTIRGKILLQLLWLEGKSWDVNLSEELSSSFVNYINDLYNLNRFEISRSFNTASAWELVVFCDASEKAYCAAVYLRGVGSNKKIMCRLVCSKTRIAPLKALTIPKLELCAAVMGAILINRVANIVNISLKNVFAFTDSTVVLCWLSRPANLSKTFVSNRVQKIVEILPFSQWNYVNTHHNPSDLATRGMDTIEFIKNKSWIDGPAFLRENNFKSFFPIPNFQVHDVLEKRKCTLSTFNVVNYSLLFINNFSSYTKMINVMAYVLRFVTNCQK